MTGRPAVSVVVPAHDAAATLGATLTALAGQDIDAAYEIVVVDDGSSDATAAVAAAADGPVVLVRQPPRGAAAARNAGVAATSAPLLAFVDADCVPTPGWLAAGVAALAGADLVQGQVLPDPDAALGPFDRALWVRERTDLFETANVFATRALFDRVGGFEQIVDVGGRPLGEDVVFGWRALRTGARVAFSAGALAHHAVFPRGPGGYVAEYRRLGAFAALAREVPELRRSFFFARIFLSRRRADFALAVVGVLAGAALRRPAAALAAVPYVVGLARFTRPWGRRGPGLAAVQVVADAVGLWTLARTSVRERTLVL